MRLSKSVLALGLVGLLTVPAWADTGLEFPRNDQVPDGQTVRFKFTNPHLNGLPIYGPGGAGITYIFKVRPKQHTGYYTTFFWGNDDGGGTLDTFTWHNGSADTYYGMHPYPQDPTGSNGTAHNWEISVDTFDIQNGLVVKNAWYTQVARVWSDGSGKHHEFYWDWPNTDAAHKVTWNSPTGNNNVNPPSPTLPFGDAVQTDFIVELIEQGALAPLAGSAPENWRFTTVQTRQVTVAARLQRDLGVNPAGAALALQLLDELETLRAQLAAGAAIGDD